MLLSTIPSTAEAPDAATSTQLALLIGRAISLLETDRNDAKRCLSDASALLGHDSPGRTSPPGGVRRGGLAPWQAKRAHEYIERHLGASVSVRDLAHLTGVSPSHFSRAFKAGLGVTPRAYIARLRIEQAKRMITSAGTALSQVAVDCGFADQPHFTRSFRRLVGVSPGTWRRMYGTRTALLPPGPIQI